MNERTCKNLIVLCRVIGWFMFLFVLFFSVEFINSLKKPVEITTIERNNLKVGMKVKMEITESFGDYTLKTTSMKRNGGSDYGYYLVPVKNYAEDGSLKDEYYVTVKIPNNLKGTMDKISETYWDKLLQSGSAIEIQADKLIVTGTIKNTGVTELFALTAFFNREDIIQCERAGLIDRYKDTGYGFELAGFPIVQVLEIVLFIIMLISFALVILLKTKKNQLAEKAIIFGTPAPGTFGITNDNSLKYAAVGGGYDREEDYSNIPNPLVVAKDEIGDNIYIQGTAYSRQRMDVVNTYITECRFDEAKEELLSMRGMDSALADRVIRNWIMYYR